MGNFWSTQVSSQDPKYDNPEDAIANDDLDSLKILKDYGCLMNNTHLIRAIIMNNYDVVNWLIEENTDSVILDENVFAKAIIHGNVNVVELLYEHGCKYQRNILELACYHQHVSIVNYIGTNIDQDTYEWGVNCMAYEHAIEQNNTDMLSVLLTMEIPFNTYTSAVACEFGRFEMLKRLYSCGALLNDITFNMAAEYGDTIILDWLKEKLCPTSEYIMNFAIRSGKVAPVKWVIENNIKYDKNVFYRRTLNVTQEMVEYLNKAKILI